MRYMPKALCLLFVAIVLSGCGPEKYVVRSSQSTATLKLINEGGGLSTLYICPDGASKFEIVGQSGEQIGYGRAMASIFTYGLVPMKGEQQGLKTQIDAGKPLILSVNSFKSQGGSFGYNCHVAFDLTPEVGGEYEATYKLEMKKPWPTCQVHLVKVVPTTGERIDLPIVRGNLTCKDP